MTDAASGDTSPAILTRLDRGERSLNALLLMAVLFLVLVPIGSNFLADLDSQVARRGRVADLEQWTSTDGRRAVTCFRWVFLDRDTVAKASSV